ncbi:hypothetical protein GCM10027168_52520 [Streptomyces capparidis]
MHPEPLQLLDPATAPGAGGRPWPAAPAAWPEPPDWRTAPLRHLPERDRRLFQLFGRGPARVVPYDCVHHAFERHAAARPLAVAAEHGGAAITYGELNRRADRLAAHLAGLGVGPGDNVALFAKRSIPLLVGILGILKAGAAYVPQDVGVAPAAQLAHIVRACSARVVLTLSATLDRVPVPEGGVRLAIEELTEEPGPRPAAPVPPRAPRPGDGCYVLFTSGTTGRPNGVTVTHRNVCNILLTEPGSLGMRPGWRVAQILNIAFDMAAWEILGALAHGATLVIREDDIAAAVARADVVIATPTVLGSLPARECSGVRVAAVAGEPCPRALADEWAAFCSFHNGCGPTETTIVNTLHRHDPGGPLTIGRPTPNNTVYVLDERLRPVPMGETGEMWAGGDGVSAGYLGDEELTGQRYLPDPFLGGGRLMFRTRDLGRWTPDGELEHLGRTDDQVKVRGFRVELDSVSAVLESVPGCTRAVTLKLDSRTLVSFVTGAGVEPGAARQAVAAALPYYCVPEAVHVVGALPLTSRGKVDKAALLRLAGERARVGGGVS